MRTRSLALVLILFAVPLIFLLCACGVCGGYPVTRTQSLTLAVLLRLTASAACPSPRGAGSGGSGGWGCGWGRCRGRRVRGAAGCRLRVGARCAARAASAAV